MFLLKSRVRRGERPTDGAQMRLRIFAARPTRSTTNPQSTTPKTTRIFISARASPYRQLCQGTMASDTDALQFCIRRWTLSVGRWTFSSMQLTSDLFPQTSKVFTVSELTRSIRGTLETRFAGVWVQGEISNYKLHPSGHQYFTLKDQRAQISCVIWRDTMLPPRQPLVDGAQVQIYGTVTVFEARGQYQLSVQIIQPR